MGHNAPEEMFEICDSKMHEKILAIYLSTISQENNPLATCCMLDHYFLVLPMPWKSLELTIDTS